MSNQLFVNGEKAQLMLQNGKVEELFKLHISEHFTWGEVLGKASPYRNYVDLRQYTQGEVGLKRLTKLVKLMSMMEGVRDHLGGGAITITSGLRTIAHNRRAKGASQSRHLNGEAVDFDHATLSPQQVQARLEDYWTQSMGYGKTFTHLDIRGFKHRFPY